LEPQFWGTLCQTLGCPEFVHEQYGPPEKQAEMARRLQEIFSSRDRDDWLGILADVPACVGPVNDLAEALADPQVRHRRMVAEIEGIPVGPGPAVKLGIAPGRLRPAPVFGEHTAQVLAGIGVGEEELADLRARGVV
jgi:crotonobetainyl-CoA:carnitine CoA-transferase CaiB-like acyl-CoA transferase